MRRRGRASGSGEIRAVTRGGGVSRRPRARFWRILVCYSKEIFSLWAGGKFFLGPALRVGSSQRVEHVAVSRVGECLGACVSVCLGDAAGDEGTYGARPGDGKGPEPPFVGATRVCGG